MGIEFSKVIDNIVQPSEIARERRSVNGLKVTKIKRKTIVEGYGIPHKYNDFRDWYVRYMLYLPYADTIELEPMKILGKMLSIDLYFDVRTGAMKYYIFANSNGGEKVLISTVGGSVRVNMPISSTKPVEQAMNKLQGALDIGSGALGVMKGVFNSSPLGKGLGGGSGIGGVNFGSGEDGAMNDASVTTSLIDMAISKSFKDNSRNKSDIVGGIGKIATGLFEIMKPSPTYINGSFSPSTSIDDPLNIYLFEFVPNIKYNEALKNNYGIPNNIYDRLGNHKGYVEISDAKFHGFIAEKYKGDIVNILKNGIYVL